MDTDSETGSPGQSTTGSQVIDLLTIFNSLLCFSVASPTRSSFPPECPGYLGVPHAPLYGSDPLALGLVCLTYNITRKNISF